MSCHDGRSLLDVLCSDRSIAVKRFKNESGPFKVSVQTAVPIDTVIPRYNAPRYNADLLCEIRA